MSILCFTFIVGQISFSWATTLTGEFFRWKCACFCSALNWTTRDRWSCSGATMSREPWQSISLSDPKYFRSSTTRKSTSYLSSALRPCPSPQMSMAIIFACMVEFRLSCAPRPISRMWIASSSHRSRVSCVICSGPTQWTTVTLEKWDLARTHRESVRWSLDWIQWRRSCGPTISSRWFERIRCRLMAIRCIGGVGTRPSHRSLQSSARPIIAVNTRTRAPWSSSKTTKWTLNSTKT